MELIDIANKLGIIESKLDDLHNEYYLNGAKKKIESLEKAFSDFTISRYETCPHVARINEDRKWKMRRGDIIISLGLLGLAMLELEPWRWFYGS